MKTAMTLLVAVSLAGCGGGGTTTPAPSMPTPTPMQRGVRQLKTPTNPPMAVRQLESYLLPSPPNVNYYMPGIAWGPDSNVWVSEIDANKIARVTPSGVITEYPVPTASALPVEMTVGPDGKIWFSEAAADVIANIDPATGAITEYPLSQTQFPVVNGEGPRGIISGPDGNVWFAVPDSSLIGRMSTSGAILGVYQVPTPHAGDTRMAVGPDGNIWFTETYANQVGRLNVASGAIDEWPTPTQNSYPYGITGAIDGNVWFTERDASLVARITMSGVITEFTTPTKIAHPLSMTTSPDGSLWFAEALANGLCRVDPVALTFVEYPSTGQVILQGITAGSGASTLWLTDVRNVAVVEFGPGFNFKPKGRVQHLLRPAFYGPARLLRATGPAPF
jgi:streptogramin lyase